jgi:DNA-binding NarL/FixJ family response regulator
MSYLQLDQATENSSRETAISTLLIRPATVLVVDDHALVRAAISQVLTSQPEIKHVVTASNYTEAEEQAAQLSPDIIWLDMHIVNGNGVAEVRRLRKLSPTSRILALDDVEDDQEAFAVIMAGAQGYRSKQDVDPDDLMTMIQMILRDEFVLRPALLTRLMQRLRSAALPLWGSENGSAHSYRALLGNAKFNGITQLTTREREILQLISQGYRDRDIAQGLHISEKTVQKHVQSILSKLGAQNRTEAAYLIHNQSIAL